MSKSRFSFWFQLFKSPFFYILRDILWLCKKNDSIELNNWLSKFSPEIVFFVASNNTFSYDFALNIIRKRKIPLILYFTDDYVSSRFTLDPFFYIRLVRVKNRFLSAINLAKHSFVIGEAMEKEYTQKYGGEFQSVMQIVEIPKEQTNVLMKKKQFLIVYLGNLGLKRWESLKDLVCNIDNLNKQGFDVSFMMYSLEAPSTKIYKYLHKPPFILFKGAVSQSMKHEILSNADLVVHVESFNRVSKYMCRLSVSTKISEYLCYGKCIFAYGPIDLASIEYLKKYDAAIICNDKKELYDKLKNIICNQDQQLYYKQSALKLAKEKHIRPDLRKIFLKCISLTAN